jgi:hypothetical protein
MTVTSIAAESSFTRCAICARPARRGATLCAQCKAAVKRARQVPSIHSEFLPQGIAGTAAAGPPGGGDRVTARDRRATRVGLPPVPGGWGTFATLIALGAAVSIIGYYATGKHEDESSGEHVSLAAHAPPVADMRSEGGARSQPPPPLPAAHAGAPTEDVSAPIERKVSHALPGPSPGGLPGRKPMREARSAGDGSVAMATDARNLGAAPNSEQAATNETIAALPPMPVTQAHEPSTPDRWQLFTAAVSRCERENALVGFFCKERARLRYCDGHWGEGPHCPSSAPSDNTR